MSYATACIVYLRYDQHVMVNHKGDEYDDLVLLPASYFNNLTGFCTIDINVYREITCCKLYSIENFIERFGKATYGKL